MVAKMSVEAMEVNEWEPLQAAKAHIVGAKHV